MIAIVFEVFCSGRMRTAPMLSAVALASSASLYSSAAATMPSSVPAFASCVTGRVRGSRYGATVLECLAASSSMRGPTQRPRRSIRSSGSGSGSCSGFVALRTQRSVGNGGGGGSSIARGFFSSGQSTRGRPRRGATPSMMALSTTATRGRCLTFRQQQRLSLAQHHYGTPFSTVGAAGVALGSAGGSVRADGERRRCRGASSRYGGCGPLMASVTDKDIMREFATAAVEAASTTQSPRDLAGSGDGAGPVVQKQEMRAGDVDNERPTGYK